MVAIYLGAVAIVVAAAAIGQAVFALGGARRFSWVAPAAGFALLLALGALSSRAPGGPTSGALAITVLTVAALAVPRVRRALLEALPEGAPLALATLLFASLPFLVSARTGILGVGDDNDMSAHLTAAQWLIAHQGHEPGLLVHGYPIGPHGLAAALTKAHVSLVHSFDAVTLAVPVLTALAALAALPDARRPARLVVAALVGTCYLAASYLAQGSFKETMEGLLLLAFALGLRELARLGRRPRLLEGLPVGLLAAGTLYVYSYVGAVWPLGAAGVALVLGLLAMRGPPPARVRRLVVAAAPALVGALLAFVIVGLPDVHRLIEFKDSQFASEPKEGLGNLTGPIPFYQALGVWLRSDFRFHPDPYWPTVVLLVVTAVGFAGGLVWWARRRDVVLPAALGAGAVIFWQATIHKNVYNQGKGLAILGPITAVVLAAPLLAAWRARAPREPRRARLTRDVARVVGVVALAAAACSSFSVLRDAPVSNDDQARDLASLRAIVQGHATLFMGVDDFATWYLHGVKVATGPLYYTTWIAYPRATKPWGPSYPFDFDNFTPRRLDSFAYVIGPNGSYRSSTPSNFRLVRRTPTYLLWQRVGPTPPRRPVETVSLPGQVIDCTSRRGRYLERQRGVAAVRSPPVEGRAEAWRGQPADAGETGTQTLTLPAGDWNVSLQYVSNTGLDLAMPGLRASLPPNLGRLGPFWQVGHVQNARRRRVTVRVTARQTSWLGSLLGAGGATRALNSPYYAPLGSIVATRRGARSTLVPLSSACGKYGDWYRIS